MAHTRPQFCEACRRPTTRLVGVIVGVEPVEGDGGSVRSAALGYCSAHRDEVLPNYLASLAEHGTPTLISDPPPQLRPSDVDAFLTWADTMTGQEIGNELGAGLVPIDTSDDVPSSCPHCGGRLSWGTGPHVQDAARRARAIAWECLHCGAAGMLTSSH